MYLRLEDARDITKLPPDASRMKNIYATVEVATAALKCAKEMGYPYNASTLSSYDNKPNERFCIDFGGMAYQKEPFKEFELDKTTRLSIRVGDVGEVILCFKKLLEKKTDYEGVRCAFWPSNMLWCSRIEAQRFLNWLIENKEECDRLFDEFLEDRKETWEGANQW